MYTITIHLFLHVEMCICSKFNNNEMIVFGWVYIFYFIKWVLMVYLFSFHSCELITRVTPFHDVVKECHIFLLLLIEHAVRYVRDSFVWYRCNAFISSTLMQYKSLLKVSDFTLMYISKSSFLWTTQCTAQ